jgi:hypothetical protein
MISRVIAEKHAERQEAIDAIYNPDALRECLVEFNAENPEGFQAWLRTAGLEEFVIPDQEIFEQQYDNLQLPAQMNYDACEALKNYKWVGAYEANKIIDKKSFQTLDPWDSPKTSDITDEDIAQQAKRAEEYMCSTIGHYRNLCDKTFEGENRGDPDGYYIPFWYADYVKEHNLEPDKQVELEKSFATQCQEHYPLYEHKTEIPKWLEHCKQ